MGQGHVSDACIEHLHERRKRNRNRNDPRVGFGPPDFLSRSTRASSAHFLPTPSWIGPLFLRERRVCPTAAVTSAAPITIKITSNVIVFPFPIVAMIRMSLSVF